MYNALLFLKQQLVDNSTITNEVPAANIYPLLAASKVDKTNFIVFTVRRDSPFTKDNVAKYNAEVYVFADNILKAAQVSDIVEEQLTNHKRIYGQSASIEITEDYEDAFVKLIFTFKI